MDFSGRSRSNSIFWRSKMAELTKRQKQTMKRHSKHHTSRHMRVMTGLMKKGMTFGEAHKKAMKDVGK